MTNPCQKEEEFRTIWQSIRSIGNGKKGWQIAFWIMTAVCTLCLPGIVAGMVANDRLRQAEDVRIDTIATTRFMDNRQLLLTMQGEFRADLKEMKALLQGLAKREGIR